MKLKLQNPLVVFDLETTGINVGSDRIVEISYIKVLPDGTEQEHAQRINPEMHIPEASSAVHGIYDADVADMPTFRQYAPALFEDIQGCNLAGFNSNHFDIPMLIEEFNRVGIDFPITPNQCVDVQNIFHRMEQRTLIAAYKFYCQKDLENAHSALADTRATYEVLQAQLDRYPDTLENDIPFLVDFSKRQDVVDFAGRMVYNENHEEIFNFGKYKGRRVEDILRLDPGYFSWVLQGDFTHDTKQALTRIQLRVKAKKL